MSVCHKCGRPAELKDVLAEGQPDVCLGCFAAGVIVDTFKAIQKADTPEFRRKYLEGKMSDVKGWDWYMDPDDATRSQAIERQHEADWLQRLPVSEVKH